MSEIADLGLAALFVMQQGRVITAAIDNPEESSLVVVRLDRLHRSCATDPERIYAQAARTVISAGLNTYGFRGF